MSSGDQQGSDAEKGTGLVDLPLGALELIYQNSSAQTRKALFGVSRWGTDVVLRESRSLKLSLRDGGSTETRARLLQKACDLAEDGKLSLALDATRVHDKLSNWGLLGFLLGPGVSQSGWHSVRELQLRGFPGGPTPTPQLIASAFPALQKLLLGNMSLNYTDLHHLAACTQLSSLAFDSCQLLEVPAAGSKGSSPLAVLPSLRELSISGTSSIIARGLAHLTSLQFGSEDDSTAELLGHLKGMSRLESLQLGSTRDKFNALMAMSLFTSCPQLKSLCLHYLVRDDVFQALLAYGQRLTSLSCSSIQMTEDRCNDSCTWQVLVLLQQYHHVQSLAFLPLHSLTRLSFQDLQLPSPQPRLKFRSWDVQEPASLPFFARYALDNLGRCPAWQASGPSVQVSLHGDTDTYAVFSDEILTQLMTALSALAEAGKQVQLRIDVPEISFGAQEAVALGRALGSSLTHLTLGGCTVAPDFWAAAALCLTGLQQLTLRNDLSDEQIRFEEIASFVSSAAHPTQIRLGERFYRKLRHQLEGVQQQWKTEHQVTVTSAAQG